MGQFFLGLDAGGTSTRARLVNDKAEVLGEGLSGPGAMRFGVDVAFGAIMKAAMQALGASGCVASEVTALAGIAGLSRKGALEQLSAMPHPFKTLHFTTDAEIACLGAHLGQDGGIVIIGTGSSAYGRVKGQIIKAGGYGFPIGDEGSGAYLGLNVLRHALRASDGRQAASPLLRAMMNRFHNNPAELIAFMDSATATDYASLAPDVVKAAHSGDSAGRRLVLKAADHVASLIRALTHQGVPQVTLMGGLAAPLLPWLSPDGTAHLTRAKADALSGAILAAQSL